MGRRYGLMADMQLKINIIFVDPNQLKDGRLINFYSNRFILCDL